MRRINVSAATAALLAVFALGGATQAGETPTDLLRDAIAAPESVSYMADVDFVRIGSERSEADVYQVEHRAPDLTHRLYTAPSKLEGDAVVTRGDVTFTIDVKRHQIVRSENKAIADTISLNNNIGLLKTNYTTHYRPDEIYAGRNCRVVVLVNRYTKQTTMIVRIDAETKLLLDKQVYAPDGSLESELRLEHVVYTGKLPASDFDLPPAYPVVDGPKRAAASSDVAAVIASVGFPATGPKRLPNGFSAVEGKVVTIKQIPMLHLLYSDGIRTVSLFETNRAETLDLGSYHPEATTVAGHPAQYGDSGPETVLAWSDGDMHYTLVGDLNLTQLQSIAASVAP
jgi:negative regulator of sigma E activity